MGCSASVEYSEARPKETSSTSTHQKVETQHFTPHKIVVQQSLESEKMSQTEEKEKSKKDSTDKEIKTKKENVFKALNVAIDKIKFIQQAADFRTENGNWKDDLLKSLGVFSETYFDIRSIGNLPYDVILQYHIEAGQQLSESKSTSVMCKVIMDSWQRGYKNENGNVVNHQYAGMTKALLALLNFSDCTREVTYDIANEPNFLETVNRILITIFAKHMQREAKDEDVTVMSRCLSIYGNLSQVDQNISRLRSLEIVPILSFFLHAKEEIFRVFALSCLANIIDEKESAMLQDKRDVVAFLLKTLSLAVKDPHHKCTYGTVFFSAQECALTVRRLGRNDANKILLVELGCLPALTELARSGKVAEQREAVGAIWVLAFEKENHRKIVDDEELKIIDLLIEFKEKSSDKEVRKAADGTLWVLRETLQNNEKYKHRGNYFEQKNRPASAASKSSEITGAPVPGNTGHIMISYNWSHQKELVAVRDFLKKQGYAVWMDIDNMGGSTLQAMAEAVELAHIVLICMSQKYKDSPNCRAEAEYAFQLRKKIIPLKMEKGYQPDGWLGFLIGAKLFYEFSGKYPFEAKVKELTREIATSYGKESVEPKITPIKIQHEDTMETVDGMLPAVTPRIAGHTVHSPLVDAAWEWTPNQVNKWIEKHNLPKKNFEKLTGKEIVLLVMMKSEAPEFFYNCLQKNLGITSLLTMAMFIRGLKDLSI
ncbi:hypothetical protein CHS0354_036897 [Potamilus streckersoni]|uniref:TIR domain-containing protein n=1 Tax=Potamilus streckersoni TaxID=2493646 RepID=A0AAE0RU59_9BIVA|nr:hypothetical protein CHS0354_036897 [Potamilus streckersoni]